MRLTPEAREAIAQEYEKVQEAQNPPNKEQIVKEQIVLDWVEHRGRVNTTELGSIIGIQPTNLGRSMKKLEQDGLIAPAGKTAEQLVSLVRRPAKRRLKKGTPV